MYFILTLQHTCNCLLLSAACTAEYVESAKLGDLDLALLPPGERPRRGDGEERRGPGERVLRGLSGRRTLVDNSGSPQSSARDWSASLITCKKEIMCLAVCWLAAFKWCWILIGQFEISIIWLVDSKHILSLNFPQILSTNRPYIVFLKLCNKVMRRFRNLNEILIISKDEVCYMDSIYS